METENFLKKDKSGVYSKTRTFWRKNFNNIFSRSKIDESFWEDLEESLISSDINVSITMELIDYLRDYSLVESINDPKILSESIRSIRSIQSTRTKRSSGRLSSVIHADDCIQTVQNQRR